MKKPVFIFIGILFQICMIAFSIGSLQYHAVDNLFVFFSWWIVILTGIGLVNLLIKIGTDISSETGNEEDFVKIVDYYRTYDENFIRIRKWVAIPTRIVWIACLVINEHFILGMCMMITIIYITLTIIGYRMYLSELEKRDSLV